MPDTPPHHPLHKSTCKILKPHVKNVSSRRQTQCGLSITIAGYCEICSLSRTQQESRRAEFQDYNFQDDKPNDLYGYPKRLLQEDRLRFIFLTLICVRRYFFYYFTYIQRSTLSQFFFHTTSIQFCKSLKVLVCQEVVVSTSPRQQITLH